LNNPLARDIQYLKYLIKTNSYDILSCATMNTINGLDRSAISSIRTFICATGANDSRGTARALGQFQSVRVSNWLPDSPLPDPTQRLYALRAITYNE
jgi:hypothetical protein